MLLLLLLLLLQQHARSMAIVHKLSMGKSNGS